MAQEKFIYVDRVARMVRVKVGKIEVGTYPYSGGKAQGRKMLKEILETHHKDARAS